MSTHLNETLPRHLKIRELRVLLSVAEHGSFRRAAQNLHITQPAITRAIADLERVLGVRLFDRTPQGVTPTLHGASFVRRARAIFGELQLAAEEIEIISSGAQGTLHLGTVPMPANGILPVALKKLLDQHPDAFVSALEASEQVLVEALKTRKIDLFISRLPRHGNDPSLRFETLYEDSLCVIASRSHRLASRRHLAYADLADEQWIIPPPGSLFLDHIQRMLHQREYELPRHAIESISILVMFGMIAHGAFIGFATRSEYEFTPMKPLLATLEVDLPDIKAAIGVVTLNGRQLNPLGSRFIECILELADTLPKRSARIP